MLSSPPSAVRRSAPLLCAWRIAWLGVWGRLRAPGALLALGLMVGLAALYLPDHTAPYLTLSVSGARGIYSSAWVGLTVAMLGTLVFSLVGFLLIRATLDAERRLGLEGWADATALPGFWYLLGKAGGHFAFLALLVGIVALTAPWIQWIRAEDRTLDVLALFLPSVLLTLPTMFLVAALAVAFDHLPRLRGPAGTLVFVALWSGAAITGLFMAGTQAAALPDPLGAASVLRELLRVAGSAAGPEAVTLGLTPAELPARFPWSGMAWTPGYLLGRLAWLAAAVVLLAAVSGRDVRRASPGATRLRQTGRSRVSASRLLSLPPFRGVAQRPVGGELRLAWSSVHPALGPVILILSVAGVAAPQLVLPAILLALMPLCSALVVAPYRYGLSPLLSSLPASTRLPWFQVLAMAILTLLFTGPALLSLTAQGSSGAVWGLLVFPVVLPILALSLATLSRGPTLFEAVFVTLWYLGPVSGWGWLDYTQSGVALGAVGISLLLLGFTVLGPVHAVQGGRR